MQSDAKPVEVFERVEIVTTRGKSLLSNAIAWVTSPWKWIFTGKLKHVPSHALIRFVFTDGASVYFESHFPEGFDGPKPGEMLERWVEGHPKRWQKARVLSLLTADQMGALYDRCQKQAEKGRFVNTYDAKQILKLWAWRRFGRRVDPSARDVCSEMVARVLFPMYDLRVWPGKAIIGFDEITPWWVQEVPLKGFVELYGMDLTGGNKDTRDHG